MFDSKLTDYTIMNTPAGKDWTKLTINAARERGLRTGVYYSLFDWHHPDYPIDDFHPLAANAEAREQPRDLDRYLDYMHDQIMELMTNYGTIDIFWPDFSMHHRQGEDWRATELMAKIREKQPDILLNNRLQVIHEHGQNEMGYGANFFTPEQKIPPQGWPDKLFEVCQTINKTWGYTHYDREFKSPRTLVRELVDTASKGGNYLLNIGPKPDGSVSPLVVDTLRAMGGWMKEHGESIYGTEATAFPEELPWGRSTRKDMGDGVTRLYLHLFDWPLDQIMRVPVIGEPVGQPWVMSLPDQRQLAMRPSSDGNEWVITLPISEPNEYTTVIVLDVKLK
jgi:alpha-L-fucosidase